MTSPLHGSLDPRDVPLYTIGEAAHYLHLAPTTLRSWVKGRSYDLQEGSAYFEPLIELPTDDNRLSFNNLIEVHVLRALRTQHDVRIRDIRTALAYAEEALGVDRLLIRDELRTHGGEVFFDELDRLINLSKSGQLTMKTLLADYLNRIDRDVSHYPIRLYPFIGPGRFNKHIAIDPRLSFGKPVVYRMGISTHAIAQRIDAGETLDELAEDYDLEREEIEDAVIYEKAA